MTGSTVRKLCTVPGEDRKALTKDSGSEAGKEKHSGNLLEKEFVGFD